MTFAKILDFWPTPLSAFGTDKNYKLHVTSLTTSSFPWPPSDSDIITGRSPTRNHISDMSCTERTWSLGQLTDNRNEIKSLNTIPQKTRYVWFRKITMKMTSGGGGSKPNRINGPLAMLTLGGIFRGKEWPNWASVATLLIFKGDCGHPTHVQVFRSS